MIFSFHPQEPPHPGHVSTTPAPASEARDFDSAASPAAGGADTLMSTPPSSPSRRPPAVWTSPVSGMIGEAPTCRPQPAASLKRAPPPLRAPAHQMHLALAEESHRAARLADDNARLRLENSELTFAATQYREKLAEFAVLKQAYAHIQQLSRRQGKCLTELERSAAQTQAQLNTLIGQTSPGVGPDEDAGEADLLCDEVLSHSRPPGAEDG